jgi:PAP2 superfamily
MLGWQIAAYWALGLLLVAGVLWLLRPQGRVGRAAIGGVRECGIVLGLFAFWQLAGTMAHHNPQGAVGRGQRILDIEKAAHINSEHAINHWVDGHSILTQLCNGYYVYGHFNGLIIFLAWVFIAHRHNYASVRMSVILVTATCFLFHLFTTVAPPRLLPGAGFIDTAAQHGQSVYGPTTLEVADQLSAFPSVHVAWAAIVAYWAWRASPGRWGWLGVAHFAATAFVVVATANHYWLDGIVAVGIFAFALLLQTSVPILVRASRPRSARPGDAAEQPALVA